MAHAGTPNLKDWPPAAGIERVQAQDYLSRHADDLHVAFARLHSGQTSVAAELRDERTAQAHIETMVCRTLAAIVNQDVILNAAQQAHLKARIRHAALELHKQGAVAGEIGCSGQVESIATWVNSCRG